MLPVIKFVNVYENMLLLNSITTVPAVVTLIHTKWIELIYCINLPIWHLWLN